MQCVQTKLVHMEKLVGHDFPALVLDRDVATRLKCEAKIRRDFAKIPRLNGTWMDFKHMRFEGGSRIHMFGRKSCANPPGRRITLQA